MADYSNVGITNAAMVAKFIRNGETATDDMFFEARRRLSPSPISAWHMQAIQKKLDPNNSRRGRPRADAVDCDELIKALQEFAQEDLPDAFVDGLISRLQSGRRVLQIDRVRRFYRQHRRQRRDIFIRFAFREFMQLRCSGRTEEHPILGTIHVPFDKMPINEKALRMTVDVLRNWLGEDVPGLGRMRNIVSQNFRLKT